MITSFIRTLILLLAVVSVLRAMGKRQIGQLQPAELVVTILLSEIAAAPMEDNDIPLGNTLIAVLVLSGAEILMSALSMKSLKMRTLLQGHCVMVIKNGVLDQKQMERLRFTLDDLLEALRQKNVFDISEVEYAIVETDGTLSVLPKPEKRNVIKADMKLSAADNGIACVLVKDGKIIRSFFSECGMTDKKLEKAIKNSGHLLKDILLLTCDKSGSINIIVKENKNG